MIVQRISHCFPIRLFFVGFILLLISLTFSAFADCPPSQPTIVFQSYRKGNWDIYTMNLDGSNVHRLTTNRWHDARPDWSPDGTKIAFYSGSDLALMDCDGSNFQRLPTGLSIHEDPDWTPDGTKIVFSARNAPNDNNDIFVLDLTTSSVRNLTNDPKEDGSPSWSPDGKWIVFESNRDKKFWLPAPDLPGGLKPSRDLHIVDSEGDNLRNLTQTTISESFPAWSPDGTQIAFTSDPNGGLWAQLYVMDVNGGKPRRLTNFKGDFAIHSPSWSPDSQQIIFSLWLADKGQNTNIYLINRDGTNLRRITDNAGVQDRHPDLFIPRLGISPAGLKTTIWGTIKQKYK